MASAKLAVLAARSIERGENGPAVALRLALHASPYARQRLTAGLRGFLATFLAVRFALASEKA